MIESIHARDLQVGDVLSTSGAVVEEVTPSHRGARVYLRAKFDDGYTQVVTTDAEHVVHVWRPED